MSARFIQVAGLPAATRSELESRGAACLLDHRSSQRNARFDYHDLPLPPGREQALAEDLLDLAATVYLADLAQPRGANEAWTREAEIHLPVREPDLWQPQGPLLEGFLQRLTGDSFALTFHPRESAPPPPPAASAWLEADCVCLLSGGLDSAAGAAALLRTSRCPRLVMHRSGNPVVVEAQDRLCEVFAEKWTDRFRASAVRLAPSAHRTGALPFPPPARRESSRRCRSFLFMALGAAAAAGEEVGEVYLYDNALLSSGVPLAESRAGSFTTHSTHPAVLADFNRLLQAMGWQVQVLNPFVYHAKGELIRDFLQPVLSPREIGQTVSCWQLGRQQRQCGGCIPCLLRRVALLAAGLPDEVYETDVLARPGDYLGTEGFRNLVDLLGWALRVLSTPELQLLLEFPSLLEMQEGGAHLRDVVRALRRQATEIYQVVSEHFPAAARLMQVSV